MTNQRQGENVTNDYSTFFVHSQAVRTFASPLPNMARHVSPIEKAALVDSDLPWPVLERRDRESAPKARIVDASWDCRLRPPDQWRWRLSSLGLTGTRLLVTGNSYATSNRSKPVPLRATEGTMVGTPVAERVRQYRTRRANAGLQRVEVHIPGKLLRDIEREAKRAGRTREEIIVSRLEHARQARRATKKAAAGPAQGTAKEFAAEVLRVARHEPATARFGPNKAFVASVWEHIRGQEGFPRTLKAFKDRLVEAHGQGLLTLSRADLVAAMDPELLRRSEIRYLNATFHFVRYRSQTK